MNKKSIRIISTMLTALLVVMALSTTAFAANFNDFGIAPNSTDVSGLSDVKTKGNQILGTIQTVGVLIAVGILMVLGIKYMMGSAEEKASYKKTMMPYIVGAVLLFGASAFAGIVYDFATNF